MSAVATTPCGMVGGTASTARVVTFAAPEAAETLGGWAASKARTV